MESYEPLLKKLNQITKRLDTETEYQVTAIGRTFRFWQKTPAQSRMKGEIKVIYEFPNLFSLRHCLISAISNSEPDVYITGYRSRYVFYQKQENKEL